MKQVEKELAAQKAKVDFNSLAAMESLGWQTAELQKIAKQAKVGQSSCSSPSSNTHSQDEACELRPGGKILCIRGFDAGEFTLLTILLPRL